MCIICKYQCKNCKKPDWEKIDKIESLYNLYCPACRDASEHYLNCRHCEYSMGAGILPCPEMYNLIGKIDKKDSILDKEGVKNQTMPLMRSKLPQSIK